MDSERVKDSKNINDLNDRFKHKTTSFLTIDKYMLPCKASYFFILAKEGCLLTYMIPFLISTGLLPKEAGLINGARFLAMILGPPFWGYLADEGKCHRIIGLMLVATSSLLYGAQPLVSLAVGDKENNVCPSTSRPKNTTTQQYDNLNKSYNSTRFFSLFLLNLFAAFFDGSIGSLVDSGVSHRVTRVKGKIDFGWNRMFGTIGFAFGSFLAGLLSEHFPKLNITCFTGAYCLFVFQALLLGLSLWFLFPSNLMTRFDKEANGKRVAVDTSIDVRTELFSILKNINVLMFFITVFLLGLLDSVNICFSSVRLQELNASKTLTGIYTAIGALSCIPLYMFASKIITFFRGTWSTLSIICFTFVVRFAVFSHIKNPWISLPVNLLNAFGAGLVIVAMVSYVQSIFPPQIYTIMLAIMNSIYYGVAGIAANAGGGFIVNEYGGKGLFLVAGVVASIWFTVLVAFTVLRGHLK